MTALSLDTLAPSGGPAQAPRVQAVTWQYLFTDIRTDRLLADLPMSDVSLDDVMSGSSSAEGRVSLASTDVRDRDPVGATVPRRCAMWAQRVVFDPETLDIIAAPVLWGGPVVSRKRSSAARAMSLGMFSWAGYFASRLVRTGQTFTQADKFAIMRWLFDQGQAFPGGDVPFSTTGIAGQQTTSGVLADRTYAEADLKPVLEAAKDLAQTGSGFDWRVLYDRAADVFTARLDLGYPRIGRAAVYDSTLNRLTARNLVWSNVENESRAGQLSAYEITEDGSAVRNRVIGLGAGTGPTQVRSVQTAADVGRDEIGYGYPLWEGSLGSSTSELTTQAAVDAHTRGALTASLASEVQVSGIVVRGDMAPTVDTYAVGDDIELRIRDDLAPDGLVVIGQVVARKIQPAQPGRNETVTMTVQGTAVAA